MQLRLKPKTSRNIIGRNLVIKIIFTIKPMLIKFLLVLRFNLSCIIVKLYLNSKNKT